MKKRIFAFIGVLLIVASVFVLPMSALDEEGFPTTNMATDLDNIDLNYQSYRYWFKDPLPEQEQKVEQFIDDNCVISFSRNALTDILMGEADVGTLRRALQSSKVFLTFSTPNDDPSTTNKYSLFCVATCPRLDVYWYDGSDDPHWELEVSGTTLNMGGDAYDVITKFEIRQSYGSPVYQVDIGYTYIYPSGGRFYNTDFECTDINIYLCKTTSIQDMSFGRFFNNIGGWQLDFPNQDSNAWQEGFDFGYQSGETVGYNNGYDAGKTEWYQKGIDYGTELGYDLGYDVGYDLGDIEGYDRGFGVGFNDGVKQNEEAVGMMGAMGDLITACFEAPYRLIATFLDIEIFGVNIGSTVVAIVGIMIALAVIKIVAGAKAGG